ncbi:MAG: hypothetical protein RR348_01720, partial [Clostridia bacterium]
MDDFKHSCDDLDKLTIFELREKARKIGVASPTSKNKDELIKCYMSIEDGNAEPQKKTNRGRPPKSSLNEITLDDEEKAKLLAQGGEEFARIYNLLPSNVVVEEKVCDNLQCINNCDCEKKSGWLDIHSDGYGFLRAENCEYGNKDTYVSTKFIRAFGLRMGDTICAIAKKNSENKPPAVVSIETVNGISVDKLSKRPNFDNLVPIYPTERLRLEMKNAKNDYSIRCIDL